MTQSVLQVRSHFRMVTRDARWSQLPFEMLERILQDDDLAIGSETEVLNLIERWNALADKKKKDIVKLLGCFRPDADSKKILEMWFTNMGFTIDSGNKDGKPSTSDEEDVQKMLRRLMRGDKTGKGPRRNLSDKQVQDALKEAEEDRAEEERAKREAAEAKRKEELEHKFVQYEGRRLMGEGYSFNLLSGHRIIQATPQRDAGFYRLRVTLTDPKALLWDPNHEVFVGASYGEHAHFGYICGISAFSGVFALRTFSSSTSKNMRDKDDDVEIEARNAPVHLTGSGNKVEFDVALEIEMQRINRIVCCKLCVILNNLSITEDSFQISHSTLKEGAGIRFEVAPAGLGEESIDVQLAWVGGGSVEKVEGAHA